MTVGSGTFGLFKVQPIDIYKENAMELPSAAANLLVNKSLQIREWLIADKPEQRTAERNYTVTKPP